MSKYLKEYISLVILENKKNQSNKSFVTWGDIKDVINKTINKNTIKSTLNKLVSKGIGTFMDIKLPLSGALSEEVVTQVLNKINNSDAPTIFITLCVQTKVFGDLTDDHKKALKSLKSKNLIQVLNKMLEEMKNVSDDTNMEGIDFTETFNKFLKPVTNLNIAD